MSLWIAHIEQRHTYMGDFWGAGGWRKAGWQEWWKCFHTTREQGESISRCQLHLNFLMAEKQDFLPFWKWPVDTEHLGSHGESPMPRMGTFLPAPSSPQLLSMTHELVYFIHLTTAELPTAFLCLVIPTHPNGFQTGGAKKVFFLIHTRGVFRKFLGKNVDYHLKCKGFHLFPLLYQSKINLFIACSINLF